jgi:hypothetical protein
MAAPNGCSAVERSFTLADVDEIWRIVECETLLWVELSKLGKVREYMKEYERVDRGMDIMGQRHMAEIYVDKLLFFLDSNASYTTDLYKTLNAECEDLAVAGGVDADAPWTSAGNLDLDWGRVYDNFIQSGVDNVDKESLLE